MKVKTYAIDIIIEEFDKKRAIALLQEAVKEIVDHGTEICSGHPVRVEPYVPYMYISCSDKAVGIYDDDLDEWLDQYDDVDKKSIVFIGEGKGD